MNPLLDQLMHRPFPDVANAIRSSTDQITVVWDAELRKAMPQMRNLTFDELKDSTPQILRCIADALASDDPNVIAELVSRDPSQGLSRLRLNFNVAEAMQEYRLLRSITVQHIEAWLGRRMDDLESASLHAVIDIMLQRSVIAMVEQQKALLRAAAETELKFLSFLSHDLNNNLNSVMMTLQALGMDLEQAGGFEAAEASLESAQQSIHDTVAGMRRMLAHERLRHAGKDSPVQPVDLHAIATNIASQSAREAAAKSVKLSVDIRPGTVVESDPELLSIILQNLVGNAVKYSSGGSVCVGFNAAGNSDHPVLWVSDEGPGIAAEKTSHIFDAFRRGESHGQQGLGLGLAVASQAAKLLGAHLTVESKLRLGTTFELAFPVHVQNPLKPLVPVTLLVAGL